jgi:hypothetical protein
MCTTVAHGPPNFHQGPEVECPGRLGFRYLVQGVLNYNGTYADARAELNCVWRQVARSTKGKLTLPASSTELLFRISIRLVTVVVGFEKMPPGLEAAREVGIVSCRW